MLLTRTSTLVTTVKEDRFVVTEHVEQIVERKELLIAREISCISKRKHEAP